MKLTFESAEFKNILSFGNKVTKIEFNNGLNLITGNNGSGKSSALLDTLSFCLFGQPYRKIKIDDLINRYNRKNLEVTYTFLINDNKYVLTRGLKPKKLSITKNGIPVKILSSKGLTQDEINKIIGINYNIFKQIISLSINHNEPFLKLPLPKKREIIEQIFSIDVFAGMTKIVKNEIKDLKVKIGISNNTITLLTQSIKEDDERIKELEETKKRFEDDKKNEIKDVDVEIRQYKNKLIEIKENGKRLAEDLKKLKPIDNREELNSKKESIISKIAEYKLKVKNSEDDIEFLESHDVCPTCNNKISNEYKKSQIKNLSEIKTKNELSIELYEEELKVINDDIEDIEQDIYKYEVKKSNVQTLKDKAKDIQSRLTSYENRRKTIEDRTFDFDIAKAKEDLKNKKQQFSDIQARVAQEEQDLNYRNIVVKALSDTGIKSYVFEEMIPILNYNINEYLTLFELPIVIKFDKFMEENIKVVNIGLENVSYYCFSEGEKKRIDMSILLSFIAIKKSLATWNCNLLVIDELFDSSIDEVGLEKLIESMNNMIDDENNLGIYIISHRLKKEYFSQFESLIEIQKKGNGFSTIKYLKD